MSLDDLASIIVRGGWLHLLKSKVMQNIDFARANMKANIYVYDLADGFYVRIHTQIDDYMIHMDRNNYGEVIGVSDIDPAADKMIGFTWYADYTTRND